MVLMGFILISYILIGKSKKNKSQVLNMDSMDSTWFTAESKMCPPWRRWELSQSRGANGVPS